MPTAAAWLCRRLWRHSIPSRKDAGWLGGSRRNYPRQIFSSRHSFRSRNRGRKVSNQTFVNNNLRPRTLKAVAERSDSLGDFGRNLRDWLHGLRGVSSRRQAAAAIADEPELLRDRFQEGNVADAWLAAYAEHLAGRVKIRAPEWAFKTSRISAEPIFDEGGDNQTLRELACEHAPLAFKRRNIFTASVDLPVSLRAGRPNKSVEEKRKTNAERQRRFRQSRINELAMLRRLVRKTS